MYLSKCPGPLMLWDLSILSIHLRILKEKLLLYHHITCLPKTALAHQVLLLQEHLQFPSLREEVVHFLNRHEISDMRKFTKIEWKRFVQRTIDLENREFIIKSAENYKKIDYLSMAAEEYRTKDYFYKLDLQKARLKFRVRSNCVSSCKLHYKSDKKNIETMFICPQKQCSYVDSLSHWSQCKSYEHLRDFRDLSDDFQLLSFYQDVINLRIKESEEEKQ